MKVAKGRQGRQEDKRWEVACPVARITDKSITILSEDKIIYCERREAGTTSNCAICEGITKEVFDRCKHKWTEY